MSELSAKHKALNILQVLTSESKSHSVKTSPRPDLSASQEILSGKYRELATLLATQHVERKTVSRLQSVDLVSRRLGDAQRMRCHHDNQEKASRRRQRRKLLAAESGDGIPETELSSCLKARSETDSTENETDLQTTQNALPDVKNKRVSFSGSRTQLSIDGYASSTTDVSDTEVIRRILRSPRRVITEETNTSSSAGRQHFSPRNKKPATSKKKPRKQKRSPKQPSKSDSPAHESETIKEFHHSDHKLNSSSNPDVLSWLRAKNKLIRKQKRSERKKERLEHLAEQRVAEEKSKKLVESEELVTEWMKVKKVESLLQRRVEKKIQKEKRESQQRLVGSSPDRAKSNTPKMKSQSDSSRDRKPSSSSKENITQKKDHVEDERKHHLGRNLEAERLHAEEKRQAKEAERRRRRLLKEAQITPDSKGPHPRPPVSKKLTSSDSKKVEKSISESLPENNQKAKSGVDISKTRPSSNPLKGLTYEDWLKQKQTDQRKQAKEAKKQEVGDPELDDLIPLLARRRIEQIKIRATRVDSGIRRPRTPSSLESDRSEKQSSPNGQRPYTWKPPTDDSNTKPDTKKSGGSGKSKTFTNTGSKRNSSPKESDEIKSRMALSMPDVINFVERPEPQGCEGTQEFPCQSPKTNQSNKNTDNSNQSEATLGNSKVTSANGEAQIPSKIPNESSTSDATIFMTEPESLKK